jgi:DNA-binding transcriptional LysR family regulator
MAPELRQLRHFLAVAERLNFTRAAADLNIAQQGLSSSIRRLEAVLGVRLLERSTREVRLTAAGRALLPEARRTVAQAERAAAAARGEVGELRIGYLAGTSVVRDTVAAFLAAQPSVRLSARELWVPEIVAGVREGSLDVGFARFVADGDGIRTRLVAEDPMVAVLARSHPLAGAAEIELGALGGETLLLRPQSPGYNAAILGACREAGLEPPTLDSPIAGNVGFLEPVALGRAFALASGAIAERWGDERTVAVPLRPPAPTLPMSVLWPADGAGPLAERFLALTPAARSPRRRASAAARGARR